MVKKKQTYLLPIILGGHPLWLFHTMLFRTSLGTCNRPLQSMQVFISVETVDETAAAYGMHVLSTSGECQKVSPTSILSSGKCNLHSLCLHPQI